MAKRKDNTEISLFYGTRSFRVAIGVTIYGKYTSMCVVDVSLFSTTSLFKRYCT